jgi:release factor glutamine methyltransferase
VPAEFFVPRGIPARQHRQPGQVSPADPGGISVFVLLRMPGVYAPQADTRLLIGALREAGVPDGARVLDLCTGSGAVALAAAALGATEVIAIDACRRAVLTTRLNALLQRRPVRVFGGDVVTGGPEGPFDVVLANPPYVPCPDDGRARGAARAWDAGPDGRRYLDPICARSKMLLAPGGTLLLVHSHVCGPETTLQALRGNGLKASVVARRSEPFGPVMTQRRAYLEDAGLIERGSQHEELVVIRGDRTERERSRGW